MSFIDQSHPLVPRTDWSMAEPFGPGDWNLRPWALGRLRLEPITPRARVILDGWRWRDVLGCKLTIDGQRYLIYGVSCRVGETLEIDVERVLPTAPARVLRSRWCSVSRALGRMWSALLELW